MARQAPTRLVRLAPALARIACAWLLVSGSMAVAETYPGASASPRSIKGWERLTGIVEPDAPKDEAALGKTLAGTPVPPRKPHCFPTDPRHVFRLMDQVPTGPGGALQPIDFEHDTSGHAAAAIKGQNTWMLWAQGNEEFWDWVLQHAYGLSDFLVMIDSRGREERFRKIGLINQPGMVARTDRSQRILGLYLDGPDGDKLKLHAAPWQKRGAHVAAPDCRTFEPGDQALYDNVVAQLADDDIDPAIYGYPTGVLGLRLFLNPDFFANTDDAARARAYWDKRVTSRQDKDYTNADVHLDPKLVRPFRIGMTCSFCHVAPHPLNPPANPAAPEWENLSSLIGNQYWVPKAIFTNLREEKSFIYQFLASQQPGTIDTSLVSTDHINNAIVINPIFEVPERVALARRNPAEDQDARTLTLKSVEEAPADPNPRHTPRVLMDGSDSVGVWGALARVYLNIGTLADQWRRLHNTIIGYRPQRPFGLATLRANSVYWQVGEGHRIDELAAFLTYREPLSGRPITGPMKLQDAGPDGRTRLAAAGQAERAAQGRQVFIDNCAICHSSRQPKDFGLDFKDDWAQRPVPRPGEPARYVLPARFADWERFKASDPYKDYLGRMKDQVTGKTLPDGRDAFLADNFFSNDLRVPVTLVGTNSARAMGTNAMRGQVWAEFSSETYRNLPPVGPVRFYNPYLHDAPTDAWGNNDQYFPPRGGPGYYRAPTLVGVWATAPYFHNNALGVFNRDPSVRGRLAAFDDAIDKLLWRDRRAPSAAAGAWHAEGDLRTTLRLGDPGFIYRTTRATTFDFPAPFVRPLITGILGETGTRWLTSYLWLSIAGLALLGAIFAGQRAVGAVLALVAILLAVVLRLTAFDRIFPIAWGLVAVLTVAALAAWLTTPRRWVARVFFTLLIVGAAVTGWTAHRFVDGQLGGVALGPIPKGTPVSLVMNMNPDAPPAVLGRAVFGFLRGLARLRKEGRNGEEEPDLHAFEEEAAADLMRASKCPDFVMDRGHWFGEALTDEQKLQLKAFLLTL